MLNSFPMQVLDFSTLLGPVVEKAQEEAVETARQEALTTAITTITTQLAAQHSQAQESKRGVYCIVREGGCIVCTHTSQYMCIVDSNIS